MRAFAQPFKATPPPRHRSVRPLSLRSEEARSTSVSSRTRCTEAATSAQCRPRTVDTSIGSQGSRGGPKVSKNFAEYELRAERW